MWKSVFVRDDTAACTDAVAASMAIASVLQSRTCGAVVVIGEQHPLRDAADHMAGADVGCLVVAVAPQMLRVTGIITSSDLLAAHAGRLRVHRETPCVEPRTDRLVRQRRVTSRMRYRNGVDTLQRAIGPLRLYDAVRGRNFCTR
ncbi:CBS domain-containing protein [Xanthomonas nasturtii]|uniref:CBS domain-containing protein n=1 Tax=Xanthomonas nasturtii TaxID=1843581 RepID=UPI003D2F5AC1